MQQSSLERGPPNTDGRKAISQNSALILYTKSGNSFRGLVLTVIGSWFQVVGEATEKARLKH